MIKKSILFSLVTLLSLVTAGSFAWGGELAYEGFDYSGAYLDTQSGGTGFNAAWVAPGVEISAGSMPVPSGYGLTTSGGKIDADNGSRNGDRELGFTIDMDPATTQVYYFSFLFTKSGDAQGTGEFVYGMRFKDGGGTNIFSLHSGSDESVGSSFYIDGEEQNASSDPGVIDPNYSYLYVGKLVARSDGDDVVLTKVYNVNTDSVMDEVYYWDAVNKADIDGVITSLNIIFGINVTNLKLDELRIGTTWEDVVANTISGSEPVQDLPVTHNLIIRLDSQHVVLGDVNGQVRIAEVIDQASGNNAKPAYGFTAPTLVENVLNGYPVIQYDGDDDYLEISDVADGSIFEGNNFTFFIVAQFREYPLPHDSHILGMGFSSYSGGMTSNAGNILGIYGTSDYFRTYARSSAGSFKSPSTSANSRIPHDPTQFVIIESIWDGDDTTWVGQAINNQEYKLRDQATALPDPGTFLRITLGCNGAYGNNADLDVAEILIYNEFLSSSERSAIGSYLKAKYDLPIYNQGNFPEREYPEPVIETCGDLMINQMGQAVDLSQDCEVDVDDLLLMAQEWLNATP